MKGRNCVDHSKNEFYFLEWLAQATGFTEEQILENMKPENQGWKNNNNVYYSINEFKKKDVYDWIDKIFSWEKSFLNNEEFFWANFSFDWSALLDHYLSKNYRIKFSKYPIKDWKIQKIKEIKTFRVKEKKIKI